MLAYDTFSQEWSALPFTMQPSLQRMGEALGQPQKIDSQWQAHGLGHFDAMAFSRADPTEDFKSQTEYAQHPRWDDQEQVAH